jgi:hypothetical protein
MEVLQDGAEIEDLEENSMADDKKKNEKLSAVEDPEVEEVLDEDGDDVAGGTWGTAPDNCGQLSHQLI